MVLAAVVVAVAWQYSSQTFCNALVAVAAAVVVLVMAAAVAAAEIFFQ